VSGAHFVDDLGVVDALQMDGRDADVGVAELALNDDERDAFVCHLDGMSVSELERGDSASHSGLGGDAAHWTRTEGAGQGRPWVDP
jgi:hypothetical protein